MGVFILLLLWYLSWQETSSHLGGVYELAASANYWAAESQQNEALTKIYQLEQFKELKPNFEMNLTASVEIIIRGIQAS